jgi:hypothetical protein
MLNQKTDPYKNIKSGQNVYMDGKTYLFLGYPDYPRKRGVIADPHGNKAEVWVTQINLSK